jgi:hypothetical protein
VVKSGVTHQRLRRVAPMPAIAAPPALARNLYLLVDILAVPWVETNRMLRVATVSRCQGQVGQFSHGDAVRLRGVTGLMPTQGRCRVSARRVSQSLRVGNELANRLAGCAR